jgi:hypothetical protein
MRKLRRILLPFIKEFYPFSFYVGKDQQENKETLPTDSCYLTGTPPHPPEVKKL